MTHPATRFRDLEAPALIDLRQRTTSSGGSQAAESLAQSLGSFSKTAFDISTRLSTIRGAKEGAEEGATGTPEFRKGIRGMTAFGRAYNDSALRSYAIKSEIDLTENAARLEAEAGTDPEAFGNAMVAIRDAVLEEAPPETRSLITQIYNKRTSAGLARIQVALVNELRAEDVKLVNEQVSNLMERVSFLRAQDTPAAHVEAEAEEAKLFILLDAAERDSVLSESEARVARAEAKRGIIFETVIARFDNELSDRVFGDPVGFIEDLKEANRTANTLTPDEEAQLENILFAELRERNTLRSARNSEVLAEETARHKAGDREATAAMLAGDLTRRDLLEMVENDELLPSVGRTLLNELQASASNPPKSDPETLFRFSTNLLSLTEEDIKTESSLIWDDRAELLLKRRTEAEGWKGTQVAREAFDRIDRSLGIIRGTLSAKMLSEDEARQRDRAFTQLYDVIDALPPEERQAAILEESEKVVRTVIRQKAALDVDKWQRLLADFIAKSDDPADMSDRERRQYDDEIRVFENLIRENEQKSQ